jgi:hypothetical protein
LQPRTSSHTEPHSFWPNLRKAIFSGITPSTPHLNPVSVQRRRLALTEMSFYSLDLASHYLGAKRHMCGYTRRNGHGARTSLSNAPNVDDYGRGRVPTTRRLSSLHVCIARRCKNSTSQATMCWKEACAGMANGTTYTV